MTIRALRADVFVGDRGFASLHETADPLMKST